jgi:hypothetical protein
MRNLHTRAKALVFLTSVTLTPCLYQQFNQFCFIAADVGTLYFWTTIYFKGDGC